MNEMLAVPPAWPWAARSSKVTFIIMFVCSKVVATSGVKGRASSSFPEPSCYGKLNATWDSEILNSYWLVKIHIQILGRYLYRSIPSSYQNKS